MKYLELVEKFNSCQLDKIYWTHKAHLITALYYVLHFQGKAYEKLKPGIIKYNESQGTINSDSGGYHETLTIFWLKKTEEFIASYSITEFTDENVEKLLNSEYCDKVFPLKFYSREVLMSVRARRNWVDPDLIV
jgi:hypothetical protein